MTAPRRGLALPLLAVVVTLLLWGSAFVAIRHLGDAFDPGALSLGRLLVGAVALGLLVLRQGWTPVDRGAGRPARRDRPAVVRAVQRGPQRR